MLKMTVDIHVLLSMLHAWRSGTFYLLLDRYLSLGNSDTAYYEAVRQRVRCSCHVLSNLQIIGRPAYQYMAH